MSELPLNLEFTIANFNRQVDQMSTEQLRDTLKLLHKSYIAQAYTYQELLKKTWGLEKHLPPTPDNNA